MKSIHIFTNNKSIVKILSKFFIIKKIFTEKKYIFSSSSIYNAKVQVVNDLEKIPKKDFKDVLFFSKKNIKKKYKIIDCKNNKKLIGIF